MEKKVLIPKDEITVNDVSDFVKNFGFEEEFEKEYGIDIDNFDYENLLSDSDMITHLLNMYGHIKKKYFVYYDSENTGSFIIFVFDA